MVGAAAGAITKVPSLSVRNGSTVSQTSMISNGGSAGGDSKNNIKRVSYRQCSWIEIVSTYDGFEAFMNSII